MGTSNNGSGLAAGAVLVGAALVGGFALLGLAQTYAVVLRMNATLAELRD